MKQPTKSKKRLTFRVDKQGDNYVECCDAPPYPVGDWWNMDRGMSDSATTTLYDNNDLALLLSIDSPTLFDFAAWNEVLCFVLHLCSIVF